MIENKLSFEIEDGVNEGILLKMYRDYSHDEVVKTLINEISIRDFKIGELRSELSEAKREIHDLKHPKGETKTKQQWSQDRIVKTIMDELIKAKQKSNEYKQECENWRNKCFSALAKSNY